VKFTSSKSNRSVIRSDSYLFIEFMTETPRFRSRLMLKTMIHGRVKSEIKKVTVPLLL